MTFQIPGLQEYISQQVSIQIEAARAEIKAEILSEIRMRPAKPILPTIEKYCKNEGILFADLLAQNRKQRFVDHRCILTAILKVQGYSYTELGKIFNRDHTSIMHLNERANNLRDTEKAFRDRLNKAIETYCK